MISYFDPQDAINDVSEKQDLFNKLLQDPATLVEKGVMTKALHTLYKKIEKVTKSIYPDNYDIQFNLTPTIREHINEYGSNHVKTIYFIEKIEIKEISLIIRFPEITITNSRRNSRIIKDLYVRVKFSTTGVGHPQGARGTLSIEERVKGYNHSHLTSNRPTEYKNFCLGSGLLNTLHYDLMAGYSDDKLQHYLLQLNEYVRWESLEGVPHFRMENIECAGYGLPKVDSYTYLSFFRMYQNSIKNNGLVVKPIDWIFKDGNYEIVDNNNFDKFLDNIMFDRFFDPTLFFYPKDEKGELYTPIAERHYSINASEVIFFKKEKVPLTIDTEIKQPIFERKKFLHTKIKQYVKSRLEYQIKLCKIREAGVARLNPTNSARRLPTESKISVQAYQQA